MPGPPPWWAGSNEWQLSLHQSFSCKPMRQCSPVASGTSCLSVAFQHVRTFGKPSSHRHFAHRRPAPVHAVAGPFCCKATRSEPYCWWRQSALYWVWRMHPNSVRCSWRASISGVAPRWSTSTCRSRVAHNHRRTVALAAFATHRFACCSTNTIWVETASNRDQAPPAKKEFRFLRCWVHGCHWLQNALAGFLFVDTWHTSSRHSCGSGLRRTCSPSSPSGDNFVHSRTAGSCACLLRWRWPLLTWLKVGFLQCTNIRNFSTDSPANVELAETHKSQCTDRPEAARQSCRLSSVAAFFNSTSHATRLGHFVFTWWAHPLWEGSLHFVFLPCCHRTIEPLRGCCPLLNCWYKDESCMSRLWGGNSGHVDKGWFAKNYTVPVTAGRAYPRVCFDEPYCSHCSSFDPPGNYTELHQTVSPRGRLVARQCLSKKTAFVRSSNPSAQRFQSGHRSCSPGLFPSFPWLRWLLPLDAKAAHYDGKQVPANGIETWQVGQKEFAMDPSHRSLASHIAYTTSFLSCLDRFPCAPHGREGAATCGVATFLRAARAVPTTAAHSFRCRRLHVC